MVVVPDTVRWATDQLLDETTFWTGTVQFERTGRLLEPVEMGFVSGFPRMAPVGMPVYARTMTIGRRRNQMAWCAVPDAETDDLLAAPTACLTRESRDRVAVRTMDEAENPLTMPVATDRRRIRDRPAIAEVEGLFPPVYTESLRYGGVSDGRVEVEVFRQKGDIQGVTSTQYLALEDGSATVRRFGGAWRVTPSESPESAPEIEMLTAPLTQSEYRDVLRGYLEYMVARTGSLNFMLGSPREPSLIDMEANGYVPGETTLADARARRDTPSPALPSDTVSQEGRPRIENSVDSHHMLLEITDAPVQAAQGVMQRGDVIAIHTLRAREAIMIDAPLEGISRDFEAGSRFGLLAMFSEPNTATAPSAPQQRAWCDMSADDRFFATSNRNCFMDRDGDGSLDYAMMVEPRQGRAAVTLGRTMEQRTIEPLPYRMADADDRPTGEFGYQYCEGDNLTGPARFAPVYRATGDEGWPAQTRCSLGSWPDPENPSRVNAGDLELDITPGEDGLIYAVVSRLSAEPVYVGGGNGDVPTPIRELGTRQQESRARINALRVRPLEANGALELEAGVFSEQAAIATLPIRYGATGRLRNEVRQTTGWGRDEPLPVGTPVYGIPMGNHGLNARMTWCAPRREDDGWDAVCFPTLGTTTYWLESHRSFYSASLRFATDSARASPPDVERTNVDMGYELRIEVFLLEWDRQDADVQVRLCGRTPSGLEDCNIHREVNATRSADGSAEVIVFGHQLRLSQPDSRDRHSVQVEITSYPEGGFDATGVTNLLASALAPIRG